MLADGTTVIAAADVPFQESHKVRCLSGRGWDEGEFMDAASFLFQTGQADDEEAQVKMCLSADLLSCNIHRQ